MIRKTTIKVVIIGNASVGKTSLMKQYVHNSFTPQYKATIGADFLSKELISQDKLVTMQIWDTAGQEKFQSVQGVFYKGSDACMLVFDLTSAASFQGISKWKDEFLLHANAHNPETFPFVLVGNKSDLVEERKVSTARALQWCKDNGGIAYYETSAKTAEKVKDAFEDLGKKAISNRSIKLDIGGSVTKGAAAQKLQRPSQTKAKSGCGC